MGVINEKLMVAQPVRNFPPLWNPNVHYRVHKSLPLYSEPIESSPHPYTPFVSDQF
jgi:hypothetical protein